ncbi:DUF6193 family natural product biosynthesis protein [Streptomyces rubiginosohelvolus]
MPSLSSWTRIVASSAGWGAGRARNSWVPLSAGAWRQNAGAADTAPEAVALLSEALPEDCGPAVEGTADDL